MRTTAIFLALALCTGISAQGVVKQEYHPNGQISSLSWASGDLVKHISYHENGRIHERGSFLDGKPHGRWTQFNGAGERICSVKFDRGSRTGVWKIETMDGLTHRLVYRSNALQRGAQYDAAGTMVAVREGR